MRLYSNQKMRVRQSDKFKCIMWGGDDPPSSFILRTYELIEEESKSSGRLAMSALIVQFQTVTFTLSKMRSSRYADGWWQRK